MALFKNDTKKAEQLLQQQMEDLEEILGKKEHEDYVKSVVNLATFYSQTGNIKRALELFDMAIKIETELEPPPAVLHATTALATHHLYKEQFDEALELLKDAHTHSADCDSDSLSSDEVLTQSTLYDALAMLSMERQQLEEAEAYLLQSLFYHKKDAGEISLSVATIYSELSSVYTKISGKLEKSIRAQVKCMNIIFKLLDQSPPEAVPPEIVKFIQAQADHLHNLYQTAGRTQDAEELQRTLRAKLPNIPEDTNPAFSPGGQIHFGSATGGVGGSMGGF